MAINEHDLELFARRVRAHVPKELRDLAEELALAIARLAGSKTKLLRPETTLQEILSWLEVAPLESSLAKSSGSLDALGAVEAVMGLEEDLGWELPDALLGHPAESAFLELVQREAARRAKMWRW